MSEPKQTRLQCGSRVLDLSVPHVMGILNVTPDSFSDGGKFKAFDNALLHAEQMFNAGASIIDVGGESTRPGAAIVSEHQELDRVIPVVEAIAKRLDVVISVDTSSPAVMRESAKAGAGMINDVRSLQREGALEAAQQSGLAICLMHMLGEPQTMQQNPQYDDVCLAVEDFLAERLQVCVAAGIAPELIVLDPGFGFAKTHEHNLSLFNHMEQLQRLNRPLLVGVSRKSIVGNVLNKPVDQRLYGSLALAALAVAKGAAIMRVHDVGETVDVVRMIAAVQAAQ